MACGSCEWAGLRLRLCSASINQFVYQIEFTSVHLTPAHAHLSAAAAFSLWIAAFAECSRSRSRSRRRSLQQKQRRRQQIFGIYWRFNLGMKRSHKILVSAKSEGKNISALHYKLFITLDATTPTPTPTNSSSSSRSSR